MEGGAYHGVRRRRRFEFPYFCSGYAEWQDAASSALSARTVDKSGPGKGVALRAVNSYLRSEQTPFLKGVEDLSWDSAAKVSSGKDGEGKMVGYWSHRFTFVALPDRVTRKVAQLVSVSDGVAQAVGSPSLLPLDAGSVSAGQVAAPANYTAIQQSDTLKNVVDSWAEAYVGGDRSKLTVLVADPSGGSSHVVDWEPAGVLTGLKPYANALDPSVAARSSFDSDSGSSPSAGSSFDSDFSDEGVSDTTRNGKDDKTTPFGDWIKN